MFSAISIRFASAIKDIKDVISWQEQLRNLIHSPTTEVSELAIDEAALNQLKAKAPQKLAWQIFDHCAAVSRIYALFEKAICDLVTAYTEFLPQFVPNYKDLNERARTQHRVGTGTILTKWSADHPLYASIREDNIAAGVSDGLRGKPYQILANAFLVSSENFRSSALTRLFADLGFDKALAFSSKNRLIKNFLLERLSNLATLESFLDAFVRVRNESSHSDTENISSPREILDYGDFLILLFDSLTLLLGSDLIKKGLTTEKSKRLAKVIHSYSDCIFGASSECAATLTVGDRVYIGKSEIESAIVISLQIGKTSYESITLTQGMEFGVKFNRSSCEGAYIYRWIP